MKPVTPFDIFSIFYNAKLICKAQKDIKFSHYVFFGIYEKTKDVLKDRYKKLWNDCENSFFTIDQLKLYLLYEYLFRTNVSIINMDSKEIVNTCNLFSDIQFEKDKRVLLALKENHKIKKISTIFESIGGEQCDSIAYDLTKKKILSPMVFVNYIDKLKDDDNYNKTYLQFKHIIKHIKINLT